MEATCFSDIASRQRHESWKPVPRHRADAGRSAHARRHQKAAPTPESGILGKTSRPEKSVCRWNPLPRCRMCSGFKPVPIAVPTRPRAGQTRKNDGQERLEAGILQRDAPVVGVHLTMYCCLLRNSHPNAVLCYGRQVRSLGTRTEGADFEFWAKAGKVI